MNRLIIIGNCTKDPELRTTPGGKSVCSFSIAVNRRRKMEGQPDAQFFRITAWEGLAENCANHLKKGRKVAVVGAVDVHPFLNTKGEPAATLEVIASEVEFLSPREVDQE